MSNVVLETLRKRFMKQKVLEISDVYHIVRTNSRKTVYRYLKKLDHLSSYTHAGKYYTLKDIPKFDKDGLWYFGDIGFSIHGTLKETIIHLVNASKNGKNSSELEKQQRVYVHNALLSLVRSKKLSREEINGLYVYFSSDTKHCTEQITHRREKKKLPSLLDLTVIQILITTIQRTPGYVTADEVVQQLKKQGSSITLEQVDQVFQEYSLEKKLWIQSHQTLNKTAQRSNS